MTDLQKDLTTRVAERNLLDREQLLALVEELHAIIVSQVPSAEPPGSSATTDGAETPADGAGSSIPDLDFTIIFDGGAIGNPGKGYGSYQIHGTAGFFTEQRLEFGDRITNNQAEFMTIIQALEELRSILGVDAPLARVQIWGDSQLVINTITGAWKARHPRVIPLQQQAVALLRNFASSDLKWQPRSMSVSILGH